MAYGWLIRSQKLVFLHLSMDLWLLEAFCSLSADHGIHPRVSFDIECIARNTAATLEYFIRTTNEFSMLVGWQHLGLLFFLFTFPLVSLHICRGADLTSLLFSL